MQGDDIDAGYPAEPPAEPGVTLGVIEHGRGHERVRISLELSRGYRPVRLVRFQPWRVQEDGNGKWWPRPSFTITIDQVPEVIGALDRAGLVAASEDEDAPRLARHDAEGL